MNDILFFQPRTVVEAVELLRIHGAVSRVIAGGTDLLPAMRSKGAGGAASVKGISAFLDISLLAELAGISADSSFLRIGAAATHGRIAADPLVRELAPVLSSACGNIGSPQIRNRGTIGGNIITAASCADTLPALLVLDAELSFVGIKGKRVIPLEEYLGDSGKRINPAEELLAEIACGRGMNTGLSRFDKLIRRNAVGKARISIARIARFSEKRIDSIKLAVGAMTAYPLRCRETEDFLRGREIIPAVCAEAADMAVLEIKKHAGERASGAYKFPVLRELIRRSLAELVEG